MYTLALIQYHTSPAIFSKPYSLRNSIAYYCYHIAALYLLSLPDSVRPTYYRESNPLKNDSKRGQVLHNDAIVQLPTRTSS